MGLNDYDTTNEEWGLSLATNGDRYLATNGDFLMATDIWHRLSVDRLLSNSMA
jgi:hypothetical protein